MVSVTHMITLPVLIRGGGKRVNGFGLELMHFRQKLHSSRGASVQEEYILVFTTPVLRAVWI
jgi:hypothetical protein